MEKISSVFNRLGNEIPDNKNFRENLVLWAYLRAVKEPLVNQLKPVRYKNGRLVLESQDERWEQVIKIGKEKDEILNRVNEYLNEKVVTSVTII
jgi:hypothetical protein